MTRKSADLVVRSRAVASQSVEDSLSEFCNETVYSPDVENAASGVYSGGQYPSLMYRFGSQLDDPAGYSRSTPLRATMHFTPAPQQEDDQMPENLLLKNMSEELVNSGLYDSFPETLENEAFVNVMRELEMQTDDMYCMTVSEWPQDQANEFQHQNSEWQYIPSVNQNGFTDTFQNMQSPTAISMVAQPSKPPSDTQGRHRAILPNIAGRRPHALPDTSDPDDRANTRGRKRGLPPEARQAAQRVRIIGACGRCHVMKEKCDLERPCKPCSSKNKRILDFPCMRELPEERYLHLFTEGMYGHLDLKHGEFFKRMPAPDQESLNKPFFLRLHQYFDDPELIIPVIKFKPREANDISKPVFPIGSNGKDYEVQPTEILSPPLLPAMNRDNIIRYTEWFRNSVRRWLECAERHEDLEWQNTFFREEYGKPWPRAVLADVCTFYHQVCMGGCPALKSSLQSTVLAYMLGHSFYVPHEDIKGVLEKTSLASEYNGDFIYVSPIYVDRFLKALLVQFFKATVKTAFKHLQDLCSPNKHTRLSRDRVLATSIILLIVTGSQQSKAVEMAVAKSRRGQGVDVQEVYKQIQEIEEWINNMIMEVWLYKFPGKVRWADDEPQDRVHALRAKNFSLMERFRNSYKPFAETLDNLQPDLPKPIDDRTFGINNIDRLLKKFWLCVFDPTEQKIPNSFQVNSTQVPNDRPFAVRSPNTPYGSAAKAKREPKGD